MSIITHMWFMFKVACVLFILKKVGRWVIDSVVNMILYLPDVPSKELKSPKWNPIGFQSPGEYGFDFDNVTITTKDSAKINAWFIKQQNSRSSPTMIFFHGNAGNMGNRLPNIKYLLHQWSINLIIVDYRGYGDSEGSPNEKGLKKGKYYWNQEYRCWSCSWLDNKVRRCWWAENIYLWKIFRGSCCYWPLHQKTRWYSWSNSWKYFLFVK